MSVASASPGLAGPYRGLAPFGESDVDALLFFGRERETEIVAANLIAARLTVLYGPSGVGKSSLLRAGVARRARELGVRRAVGRGPDVAVVVFSAWADDPVAALGAAIDAEVTSLLGKRVAAPPGGSSLADVVEHWSDVLDGELYLALDQLEEYFVYHGESSGPGTLVGELPEVVLRSGLKANVLLSLRADALAELDVFKGRIPNVFANYLRLDRLDRRAGAAAISGPVLRWNDLVGEDERISIQPELVGAVLAEVAAGRLDLGGGDTAPEDEGRIEAPYLQLVMERLWTRERDAGSRILRLSTLAELGGAELIVRDHLDRALHVLGAGEQATAALMFDHLVTPSGTKIAHRATDLAEYAHVPLAEVQPVLAALGRERILRPLDGPVDTGERYEIFHDVLAAAVLDWRRRREVLYERHVARRRQRRLAGLLAAALALLIVMTAVTAYAFEQRRTARDQAQLALAAQHLAQSKTADARRQQRIAEAATKSSRANARRARAAQAGTERALHTARAAQAATANALSRVRSEQGKTAAALGEVREQQGKTAAALGSATAAKRDAQAKARLLRVRNQALRRQKHDLVISRQAARLATLRAQQATRTVLQEKTLSDAQYLAYEAIARFGRDPEATLADGLEAYRKAPKLALVERALRIGLLATKGKRILPGGGGGAAVLAATFDATGRFAVTASAGGTARVFDVDHGRLLRTFAVGAPVRIARFNPDGSLVATGSRDGRAILWNVASGSRLHVLVHAGPVVAVDFSPDGKLLLTASEDGTLGVLDVASGLVLRTIKLPGPARTASFSPAGARILAVATTTAAKQPARIYDTVSGELLQSFTQRGQVTTAAFSPDGELVATGGRDDLATLFDSHDGRSLHTLAGHRGDVLSLTFSHDGRLLATTSSDDTAILWDTRSYASTTLAGHTTAVVAAAFSPDGSHLATASTDRTARIWAIANGEVQSALLGHRDTVGGIAWSPDGTNVLTAGGDGNARVWDARTESALRVVGKHDGRAFGAAWFPNSRRIATAGADGFLRVWDATRRVEVGRFAAGVPLDDAAVSADGARVAAAGTDGVARVWKLAGGAPQSLPAQPSQLRSVAFSPDGSRLVTGGDDFRATVWQLASPRNPVVLQHADVVFDAVFSPDGTLIATACGDKIARIWRASDGKLLAALVGHTDAVVAIAFSRDGRRLATSSRDKDSRIWNVRTGALVRTLRGHSSVVSGVSFSADGRWAATAGAVKAGIWATTGDDLLDDRLFFLAGPTGQLTSTAWSPDGWNVAVTSFDGTVRTYACRLCGNVDLLVRLARKRLHELAAR